MTLTDSQVTKYQCHLQQFIQIHACLNCDKHMNMMFDDPNEKPDSLIH